MDALAELVESLPAGVVATDPATLENYRYDWSRDTGAGTPIAVVRAEDAGQVQAAVRWAAAYDVPVVPRGAGSGLSGGASAVDGGIVLSLERMRAIEIDADCQVAVVEPGAFNAEVKAAAREHGLWYPPDPSSFEICSIGGNVATNAGGLCCVKYGVTTDYVLGLDVVLADGTLITLGGKRIKDVAGLSLVKLFVGSEGTLGIVTRAILRLVPHAAAAGDAGGVVRVGGGRGRGRRRRTPHAAALDDGADGPGHDQRRRGLRTARPRPVGRRPAGRAVRRAGRRARPRRSPTVEAACEAAGATEVVVTDDPEEGEMFVAARRAAFPAVEARGALLLEDVGAAVPLLPDLLAAVAEIARVHDVEIPTVAHAGDGNTHPIIVYTPGDADSERRARAAFDDILQAAIRLGGTITGEHGVGRTKKAALPDQLGEDVMALTRRIKDALDPAGILNPGAVL